MDGKVRLGPPVDKLSVEIQILTGKLKSRNPRTAAAAERISAIPCLLVQSHFWHIGPAGEAFTFAAFVYRTLAGAFFAVIYHARGFAVAAWTHALYDVYVLSLSG